MELEQARKRAAELRAVIEKNNRLYYDQDAPELEDYEYDQLTRELKTIEAQFPQLVTPDSPTQHVGGTPSGKFSKVAHAVKMESLQDAFSLDEPSMGLSPLLVKEIFKIIRDINRQGVTVLLVEQNAKMALDIANRAYVLETGTIKMEGEATELANNIEVRKAYLGCE